MIFTSNICIVKLKHCLWSLKISGVYLTLRVLYEYLGVDTISTWIVYLVGIVNRESIQLEMANTKLRS